MVSIAFVASCESGGEENQFSGREGKKEEEFSGGGFSPVTVRDLCERDGEGGEREREKITSPPTQKMHLLARNCILSPSRREREREREKRFPSPLPTSHANWKTLISSITCFFETCK